jgi:hypothetical protein
VWDCRGEVGQEGKGGEYRGEMHGEERDKSVCDMYSEE